MRTRSQFRPKSPFRHTPIAAALAGALTQVAMAACPTATGALCVTNPGSFGTGTFQDAVVNANANCNLNPNPVIEFDLPAPGPHTIIFPATGFTFLCSPAAFNVTIDGTSQPGSTPNTSSSGFNAVNQVAFSGNGVSFQGLDHSSGFSYGGSLTVKGIDFKDFYYGGGATPCSISSPIALNGPVNVSGSRFLNSCTGVGFESIDPDGFFGGGASGPSTIGGPLPADRNVFSGNYVESIITTAYGGEANIVNNFVGTPDGTTSGGGTAKGIFLNGSSSTDVVGNVISGNGGASGIYIQTVSGVTITGNKIGTTVTGTALGNAGAGILSYGGFPVYIADNTIAHNGGDGFVLMSGNGHELWSNRIYSNGGKSINLGGVPGTVPNDTDDVDFGPNDLQNFPVITSVIQDAASSQTTINWSLNSSASTAGDFSIEFFSNPGPSSPPHATLPLAPIANNTIAGPGPFTIFGSTVIPGLVDYITATATDVNLGNTSEVSPMALARGLAVSPTSFSFGNIVVGTTSTPGTATLSSIGANPVTINLLHSAASPTCYGGPPPPPAICAGSQFSCTSTCTTGSPYSMGTSCSISATFAPIALGPATTTIYICDDAGGSPRAITLSGNAVAPPAATASPASHDFGAVEVGGLSATQAFTISNPPSSTTISLTPFSATAPFQIVTNSCGATLASGASCTVTVRYAPTAVGAATGSLSSTASSGGVSVALAGTGTAGPPPTLTPASLDFGAVTVGTNSAPATFTLSNPALTTVTVSPFTVAAPFGLLATTCGTSLPPSGTCTADVKFSPTAPGPATGALQVTAGGATLTSSLVGNGSALPMLQITPSFHDFGSILVGILSPTKTFTIFNPAGGSTTSISPVTMSGPFQLVSTTCGASLAGLSSCEAVGRFVPTASGPASGSLAVSSSSGMSSASLTGNGVRQAALSLPTAPIEFGSMIVGSAPVSRTIAITNSGNDVLGINSIGVSAPYTVFTTCGVSLVPNDSCNVTVGFNPTVIGDFGGFLSVSTNAPGGSFVQVPVHAAVQARPEPIVRVSPRIISFGSRFLGSPAPNQAVTLSNEGGSIANLVVSLNMPHFTIVNSGCGATLAPGASCQIELGFSPQGFGPRRGRLVVESNSPDSPIEVSLSGAGCRPVSVPQSRGAPPIDCSP